MRARYDLGWSPPGAWSSTEPARFVCDGVRALQVWAIKRDGMGEKDFLWVGATIGSAEEGTTTDITLALVNARKVLHEATWEERETETSSGGGSLQAGPLVVADAAKASSALAVYTQWKPTGNVWTNISSAAATPKLRIVPGT